jgi:hypothetical protein
MDDLAIKLQETTDRSLRNESRIEKLETDQKALSELALSVQELATNQVNMKDDLTQIKKDVRSLITLPTKRWNSVVDKVITLLVGAFVAWLLTSGAG